ncbi:DUF1295 domain-containing protein [Leucobacter sp. M11]|uniref:DUF1295 domain-containing protein n=1 Tax=Leucobacter sp. M11 TaxID=2993565 RepID=UPI002D804E10|nr:DUF1295 domain-containing protein [Leucobacter sp. M11]MEB4615824.1 DUF1295 domain-containing protein [Leucobacter sp. M11]
MPDFPLSAFLGGVGWSALGILALLLIVFTIGCLQQRHQVIDAAWGLGFVTVAAITFFASAGHGDPGRRLLLLAIVAAWGIRLGGFLAWRMRDGHEDPRYVKILGSAPGNRNAYAIRKVYLPQGIVMLLVSLTIQVGMYATGPLGWLAWLGLMVWLVGMFFEVVGDWQLAAFKRDPARRGTVLDTGVWRLTRHPNYFGDAAVWWGIFLVAADSWPGVLTILSPLLMTWALAARTGKPLTESRMLERPGYREYMARTSGFFPLPPQRGASPAGGDRRG